VDRSAASVNETLLRSIDAIHRIEDRPQLGGTTADVDDRPVVGFEPTRGAAEGQLLPREVSTSGRLRRDGVGGGKKSSLFWAWRVAAVATPARATLVSIERRNC
jgi:hypothetical protein